MTCHDIADLTPLYLSGELDTVNQREFHAHLSQCSRCAGVVDGLLYADLSMRDALSEPLPDTTRIEQAVRSRISTEHSHRSWYRLAAVVAATAIVGLSYTLMAPHAPARLYADAARDHRREVMEHQPRHWRSSTSEIDELASRFGLTAEKAAGLDPAGYHLKQAKTCGLDGSPALHLVYASATGEFSAYIRPRSAFKGRTMRQIAVGNEHLASFQTDRFDTVIVTGDSSQKCLEIARATANNL